MCLSEGSAEGVVEIGRFMPAIVTVKFATFGSLK